MIAANGGTFQMKRNLSTGFFFLKTNTTSEVGNTYQLRGMPGSFYYPGEEILDLSELGSKNGELEVGKVPEQKLVLFKEILEKLPVVNDESLTWNCQNWSISALDKLRDAGFIGDDYSNNVIRYWLREDQ